MKHLKIRNRVVSIVIAVLLCLLSAFVPSYSASAAYINTIIYYDVYDVEYDMCIGSYFLEPVSTLSSNISAYAVFGNDTRVVDFTKSGTVKLMSDSSYIGTGFVIDEHTIATAAHCVYDKTTSSDYCGNNVSKILLFDGNGNISKTVTSLTEIHVPRWYITTNADSYNAHSYDYALITVEDDLSDYAIFNLGIMMDEFPNTRSAISVTGFPEIVNNSIVNSGSKNTMYTGTGTLLSCDDFRIYYDNDTSGGNSGGPVYVTTSFNGNVYYTVIGIHTTGNARPNGANTTLYNAATRVTTNLLQFYKNNPNVPYL